VLDFYQINREDEIRTRNRLVIKALIFIKQMGKMGKMFIHA